MIKTLSEPALKVINDYLHLPIPGHDISCPYFNNRYASVRGGLRVTIGKGNISDIVDEVTLLGLREKVDVKKLSNEELKKFMVDNGLGVDCSGLVYHILDEELKARGKGAMKNFIKFPFIKTPWRKFLSWLRPAEHAGVRTIADGANSKRVNLADIAPGDMVVLMKAGPKHDRNHVLLVTKVEYDGNTPKTIQYIHSYQWRTDGMYNHGVKEGKIDIADPKKPLLEQIWTENSKVGQENETFEHAKLSEELYLARFLALV